MLHFFIIMRFKKVGNYWFREFQSEEKGTEFDVKQIHIFYLFYIVDLKKKRFLTLICYYK